MSGRGAWSIGLGLIYLYVLAPVLIVVITSFNAGITISFPLQGVSLRWYGEFLHSSLFVQSFVLSAKVAVVSGLGATLIGLPAALALVRYRVWGKQLIQTFLLSSLFVPSLVVGVALLNFFVRSGLRGTLGSMIAAHILLTFPYVVRTVMASLAGIDPAMEEAAMALGAPPLRVFWRVTLPLISSGISAGILFAFVVSFGELDASLFISGPTTVTLPIQIFSNLQWNTSPVIAAVSTVQIALVLAAAVLIERMFGLSRALEF